MSLLQDSYSRYLKSVGKAGKDGCSAAVLHIIYLCCGVSRINRFVILFFKLKGLQIIENMKVAGICTILNVLYAASEKTKTLKEIVSSASR